MTQSRRHFLQTAAAVSLGFSGLGTFVGCDAVEDVLDPTERFGPLVPDPDHIVDLPAGFSYRIIARAGEVMSDGFLVPVLPDGMAAFGGPDGTTLLLCNHEVNYEESQDPANGAFGVGNALVGNVPAGSAYDMGADDGSPRLGGVTTLVYDTGLQARRSQHLSLAGTLSNCAGGPTPWNSWISCEEAVDLAGGDNARDHGYNFEVPATARPGLVPAVPISGMGRFNHEAVAVDPNTGIVYQTEDEHDGLIYRYVPQTPGNLLAGGRLEALTVRERPGLRTRNWEEDGDETVPVGMPLTCDWIALEQIHSPDSDLRYRGFDQGAAMFARAEGMWYGNGVVYFACTNGGAAKHGQIWKYSPGATVADGGSLELFVEPNDLHLIEGADNLTVAPWGDLILCEDGTFEQFLVGVTPKGGIYKLARNARSDGEFAGACFSPDGTTLFVNLQADGLTLAITGRWRT